MFTSFDQRTWIYGGACIGTVALASSIWWYRSSLPSIKIVWPSCNRSSGSCSDCPGKEHPKN